MIARPDRGEAAEYYFTYIDLVPAGDIRDLIDAQQADSLRMLRGIDDATSLHRYEPGKWSIRDVVNHLSDTERLFVFRAFWFARGFDTPLPSFDQHVAVGTAAANDRSWSDLVEEFARVRGATLSFFRSLTEEAWTRHGIASGNPFTVRALAYLVAGHVTHHLTIIRQRYLPPPLTHRTDR